MSEWTGYEEFHYFQCNFCLKLFPIESQIRTHLRKGQCHKELIDSHKETPRKPKGVLVYKCDKCLNGAGTHGVVFGYVAEGRELGCKHKLKKQLQYEDNNGNIWWEDIKKNNGDN